MDLNHDQKEFYTNTRERCRAEVERMNTTLRMEWDRLNSEIARVSNLMDELEAQKQVVGQMHSSASVMLGLPDDLDVSPAIQQEAEAAA